MVSFFSFLPFFCQSIEASELAVWESQHGEGDSQLPGKQKDEKGS